MSRITRVAVIAAALCIASPAAADVNFAPLAQDGGGFNSVGLSYDSGELTFVLTPGRFGGDLGAWQRDSGNHPAGGDANTALVPFFAESQLTITPNSGTFDLFRIDVGQWGASQGGGAGTFTITFNGAQFGGGTVTQTFTVANNVGAPVMQTFAFSGFTDLVEVTVGQNVFAQGGAWQINNLITTSDAVPEPGTWALLIAGFGLAGATLRSRRLSRA